MDSVNVSDEERLDIFVDFLGSQEWNMPVQSFIDYYCVIFATDSPEDHLTEKKRVYDEYKQVVGSNLDRFMRTVMHMDASGLCALMALYDGDYTCLEYVLAVEDYSISTTLCMKPTWTWTSKFRSNNSSCKPKSKDVPTNSLLKQLHKA